MTVSLQDCIEIAESRARGVSSCWPDYGPIDVAILNFLKAIKELHDNFALEVGIPPSEAMAWDLELGISNIPPILLADDPGPP